MPDNWYAAKDRDFFPIYPSTRSVKGHKLKECYLIRNDYIGHFSKNYKRLLTFFKKNYTIKEIANFSAGKNKLVKIFHCQIKAPRK